MYVDSLWVADTDKEATRIVQMKNNNNYITPKIKSYWNEAMSNPDRRGFLVADPDFYDGFMNIRAQAMFEDDINYPGLLHENTSSLDPQFADYFDYSDTLINYSKYYYRYTWPEAKPTRFMLDPDGDPLIPTDPMFYNLKVTNPSLRSVATDGGVIGDRTWELPDGYNNSRIVEIVTTIGPDKSGNSLQQKDFILNQGS